MSKLSELQKRGWQEIADGLPAAKNPETIEDAYAMRNDSLMHFNIWLKFKRETPDWSSLQKPKGES